MTRSGSACLLIVTLLIASALPATPARNPPRRPQDKALAKAEQVVLDAAVSALKKEYEAHQKDPLAAKLRPQSSYFLDNPVQLSPESVLDFLERPVTDDPRLCAYVKWQLLSGAPEKFDPSLVPRALSAYQKAPPPAPRFGLATEDRMKLDALLAKAKKEDDAALSAKVDERVRQETEANKPILAYRDALYARLPEGYDTLVAGFRDAHERTLAAAGGGAYDGHCARVVKDAQAWAQSGVADPEQCGRLADLVAKLRFVRSPPYYERASWRYDKLAWSNKTDAVYSAKKLSDLEIVLRDAYKAGKAQQAAQQAAQRNPRGANKKPK